jgi:hypothetical protein
MTMLRLPGLGFLNVAEHMPVCLIGDDVLVADSRAPARWRRIGSLAAHAQALLDWAARHPADDSGDRTAGCLRDIAELTFCARELVPYLMYLATRNDALLKCPPEVELRLNALAQRLPPLPQLPNVGSRTPFGPDELAAWFGTPCVLGNRLAIPLEPMRPNWPFCKPRATIGEVCYAQRHDKRPLPHTEYVAHVRNVAQQVLRRRTGGFERRALAAAELEHEYEEVLACYHPQPHKSYTVVYAGAGHQLQYGRGQFMLVRGPVSQAQPHGLPPALHYMGLPIKGQTRREWLAGTPRWAAGPSGFWSPVGAPCTGNVCLGNRQQFTPLLADRLTDAEALVLFLDAAVRIATGRAAQHRRARTVPAKASSIPHPTPTPRRAVISTLPASLPGASATLSVAWLAWEKCFVVADVLRRLGAPNVEYALLGAADEKDPGQVNTMLLLQGQEVAPDAVRVSGHQVLAAVSELRRLGRDREIRLVPVVFVHRHLGGCGMSATDVEFLGSVFIHQVATVHPSPQSVPHDAVGCGCLHKPHVALPCSRALIDAARVRRVSSVAAFSLIVNGSGEFALHGARKFWCRGCGRSRVEAVPVQLALVGARSPSAAERAALRTQVEQEVMERIRLPGTYEHHSTR